MTVVRTGPAVTTSLLIVPNVRTQGWLQGGLSTPSVYPFSFRQSITTQYVGAFTNPGNADANQGLAIYAGENDGGATASTDFLYCGSGDGSQAVGALRNVLSVFQLVTLSDRKSKINIAPTKTEGLKVINKIGVYEFDKQPNPGGKMYHNDTGFIAQDLQEAGAGAVVSPFENGMLGVSLEGLVPFLVKALQELDAKVEELKKEVQSLKKE